MFIVMRPGGRRVHPLSQSSVGCVLGVVGFIQFAGVIGVWPGGRRVHPVS